MENMTNEIMANEDVLFVAEEITEKAGFSTAGKIIAGVVVAGVVVGGFTYKFIIKPKRDAKKKAVAEAELNSVVEAECTDSKAEEETESTEN